MEITSTCLRFIIMVGILIFCGSCWPFPIYSSWTSTGTDPFDATFPDIHQLKAERNANEFCNNFLKQYKNVLLLEDDDLQIKTDKMLKEIEADYIKLSQSTKFFCYYEQNPFNPKIGYRSKIFAISKLWAQSYPNGEIHLSRSILDGGLVFSAKNEAQLYGLLAHEFIHIAHHHIAYQWAAIEGYDEYKEKKVVADLTKLTKILPLAFWNEVYSTRDLTELYLTKFITENLADLFAVILMEYVGYDSSEYVKFLKGIFDYAVKLGIDDNVRWLYQRIICLEGFVKYSSGSETGNKHLVIQSVGSNRSYRYHFDSIQWPYLARYVDYWICVLTRLGRSPRVDRFIKYDNGSFSSVLQNPNILPLVIDGRTLKPIEVFDSVVFPEKMGPLSLFPTLCRLGG